MFSNENIPAARKTRIRGAIQAKGKSVSGQTFQSPIQLKSDRGNIDGARVKLAQNNYSRRNDTGLPDKLKTGIENLSGYSMDDVRVHYNSSKPAQLNAYAYTQGTEIHVAPGQEKHLPHEAWHVVQQMQGRVKPTYKMRGVNINDDPSLERAASVLGAKANGFSGVAQLRKTAVSQSCIQCTKFQSFLQHDELFKDMKENPQKYKDPAKNYRIIRDMIRYYAGKENGTYLNVKDVAANDLHVEIPPEQRKGISTYDESKFVNPEVCPKSQLERIYSRFESNKDHLKPGIIDHLGKRYDSSIGKAFWKIVEDPSDPKNKEKYKIKILGMYRHTHDKQKHQNIYEKIDGDGPEVIRL